MANYFMIKYDNAVCVNGDLYRDALAKGERAFRKILASNEVVGKPLLDQVIYTVTPEQQKLCETYNPIIQDFDDAVRHFNIVSKDTLCQIKKNISEAFYNAHVISIDAKQLECFKYKCLTFFKVCDWSYEKGNKHKYHALPKMAAVKICGFLYIALNAVDVRVEAPIIATIKS